MLRFFYLFTLILLLSLLVACETFKPDVVTDIRGKPVDPETLMCKSVDEIGGFSGGNAIVSKRRAKRVEGDDILALAKELGATHIRWTDYGRRGTSLKQSGEAYRCVFRTRAFRKNFATNIDLADQ
ncbi:MAG: hypothetical protein ACC707_18980 [Thiohalomonadales bacterium]